MPNIKLTYFDFPGRAEASRLALTIGGIPFEDERLLLHEFVQLKSTLPYGSVPILTVDGQVYAQSAAILRYCGKLAGLYPENPLQAQRIDEVLETVIDFITGMEAVANENETEGDDRASQQRLLNFIKEAVPRYLGGLDQRLKSFGPGPWAVGDNITIADLAIYVCLLNVAAGAFTYMSMNALQAYGRVVGCFHAVRGHPKVSAWNEELARKALVKRQAASAAHEAKYTQHTE